MQFSISFSALVLIPFLTGFEFCFSLFRTFLASVYECLPAPVTAVPAPQSPGLRAASELRCVHAGAPNELPAAQEQRLPKGVAQKQAHRRPQHTDDRARCIRESSVWEWASVCVQVIYECSACQGEVVPCGRVSRSNPPPRTSSDPFAATVSGEVQASASPRVVPLSPVVTENGSRFMSFYYQSHRKAIASCFCFWAEQSWR